MTSFFACNREAENQQNCLVLKACILNGLLDGPFQTSNSLFTNLNANELEQERQFAH